METVGGSLVPGRPAGELLPGEEKWTGWRRPLAFRCDFCGAILPYGCILMPKEHRTGIDQARLIGDALHRCGACEGLLGQQLGMGL